MDTSQYSAARLSHGEAAETFSELLAQLPPGRLRCSALLNRAPLGTGRSGERSGGGRFSLRKMEVSTGKPLMNGGLELKQSSAG